MVLKNSLKVIIDTNFIISTLKFKIDLFSEVRRIINTRYELYILDGVIDELKKLQKTGKGKDKRTAKLALAILKVKVVKILKTKKDKIVDDLIVEMTKKEPDNYAVATQDLELKRRLKAIAVRRISIRKKQYLVIS